MSAKFDPKRYLTAVKGKGGGEYLEVKHRIRWLRAEHPDAEMSTELIHYDPQNQVAVFKATVRLPGGGSATGWARETAKTFGDWTEKAETAAVGRALGALGYGTEFARDFEMVNPDGSPHVADAPARDRPAPTKARAGDDEMLGYIGGADKPTDKRALAARRFLDRATDQADLAARLAAIRNRLADDGEDRYEAHAKTILARLDARPEGTRPAEDVSPETRDEPPAATPTPATPADGPAARATDAQARTIAALVKRIAPGQDTAPYVMREYGAWLKEAFGVTAYRDLTRAAASALIDKLRADAPKESAA